MASALVPVKQSGSLPPLFCVHGEPLELARRLRADRPVYALNFVYGDNNIEEIPADIVGLARVYIRDIQRVQPTGPYYLFGFSAGATIAYEIARQLLAGGFKVAHVCLGEPVLNPKGTFGNMRLVAGEMQQQGVSAERLLRMWAAFWKMLRRRPGIWVNRLRVRWHGWRGTLMPPRLRWLEYLGRIRPAVAAYRYGRLRCSVDLVYRDLGESLNSANAEFWRTVLGDATGVHFVAHGREHLDLMHDPALAEIAALLDERLGQGPVSDV